MASSIKCSFAGIMDSRSNAVTLVEYYDYECIHCRRMESMIQQLQADYPNLRIIHRVTPLLNNDSYRIASFVLAVQAQQGWSAWQVLHSRLMQLPQAPTLSDVEAIAEELDLNVTVILKRMQQANIQERIKENIALAETHVVSGKLALPILVFGLPNDEGQDITLRGEQPYELLSAIVLQLLDDQHVQLAKNIKKTEISKSIKNI